MPAKTNDLAGVRVGRLVVIERAGFKQTASGGRQYFWTCQCDCGKTCRVDGVCLRRGSTKSCGCGKNPPKHGMSEHPLYSVWLGMKGRCTNPSNQNYAKYGGRGIQVCKRWLNSFQAFFDDMGDRPTPKHTIERENNDGNYEPGNCRWATRADQNENTSQTKLLTHDGVTLSIGKWAKRLGVNRTLIRNRLRDGWSVERALSTPPRYMSPARGK